MMNALVWMVNDEVRANKKVGGVVYFQYTAGTAYVKKSFATLEEAKEWAMNNGERFTDYYVMES